MSDLLIDTETILEITHTFWGAFLPDSGDLHPGSALPSTEDLRGCVRISGSWEGVVELSCSLAVASHVASRMFALPEEQLSDADIHDAVGELSNIVGGNIKSLLPPPTSLSIPFVETPDTRSASEEDWRFSSALDSEVLLAWHDEPLIVRVWRSQGSSADSAAPTPGSDGDLEAELSS